MRWPKKRNQTEGCGKSKRKKSFNVRVCCTKKNLKEEKHERERDIGGRGNTYVQTEKRNGGS